MRYAQLPAELHINAVSRGDRGPSSNYDIRHYLGLCWTQTNLKHIVIINLSYELIAERDHSKASNWFSMASV